MCLIVLGIEAHADYPLIILANRDEFYARPTEGLSLWSNTDFYAGKDLQAGGTWLAISKKGKFAAITNIRDPKNIKENAISRGNIIVDFMKGNQNAFDFLNELKLNCHTFNGFNLICGTFQQLLFMNSYEKEIKPFEKGIYGLSNASLNTGWPKVEAVKSKFKDALSNKNIDNQLLISCMQAKNQFDKNFLPNTGVGIDMEKMLSPIFIESSIYGTRNTTIVSLNKKGKMNIYEFDYLKNKEVLFEDIYPDFAF